MNEPIETVENSNEVSKVRPKPPGGNNTAKIQFEFDGQTFSSIREAAKAAGVAPSTISRRIKSRAKKV
jgi:hypothetical protein